MKTGSHYARTGNPTRAALGFLVAKKAIEDGYTATLFLAGDAVKLLQDSVLNTLMGVGTGKLREHCDATVMGAVNFICRAIPVSKRDNRSEYKGQTG